MSVFHARRRAGRSRGSQYYLNRGANGTERTLCGDAGSIYDREWRARKAKRPDQFTHPETGEVWIYCPECKRIGAALPPKGVR